MLYTPAAMTHGRILLNQAGPGLGLPSVSPFCMRLEAFLRLVGLDYEVDNKPALGKAPKGKVPWIDDGDTSLADTHFIIEHLKNTRGLTIDARLSAAQRATAHACTRMLTESFYWVLVHSRWLYPPSWAPFKREFVTIMPPVVGHLIIPLIRRGIRKQAHAHGMGRHSDAEIAALARADLEALEALLGDREWFFAQVDGDAAPTSFDATVYAFVAHLLVPPFDTPQRRELKRVPKLIEHTERMHARLFPELPLEVSPL